MAGQCATDPGRLMREFVGEEWARRLTPLIVALNELESNALRLEHLHFEFTGLSDDLLEQREAELRRKLDAARRRSRSASRRDRRHLAALVAETEAQRPKFDPILGRELSEAEQAAHVRRWHATRGSRIRRARDRVLAYSPRRTSCVRRPQSVVRPRRTCGGRHYRPGVRRTVRAHSPPGGSDPDSAEPGEHARRATDDDVAARRLPSGMVA